MFATDKELYEGKSTLATRRVHQSDDELVEEWHY